MTLLNEEILCKLPKSDELETLVMKRKASETIVIDYGEYNIAKPYMWVICVLQSLEKVKTNFTF